MKSMVKTSVFITALFAATSIGMSAGNSATTLTTTQKQQLQYLVEEEKLARDVYNYFATNVTSQKFANIAKAEQTHMNYVVSILKTYKVANPAATTKPGVFKNAELQKLYNELIDQGKTNITAAFAAGVTVEQTDIADLQKIMQKSAPSDMQLMLTNLLKGSQNHLVAFSR